MRWWYISQLVALSERHRMLLTELTSLRMRRTLTDVTRLHGAYVSHAEHTRRAYLDYCNGLQNAVEMCARLRSRAPSFAFHVQVSEC